MWESGIGNRQPHRDSSVLLPHNTTTTTTSSAGNPFQNTQSSYASPGGYGTGAAGSSGYSFNPNGTLLSSTQRLHTTTPRTESEGSSPAAQRPLPVAPYQPSPSRPSHHLKTTLVDDTHATYMGDGPPVLPPATKEPIPMETPSNSRRQKKKIQLYIRIENLQPFSLLVDGHLLLHHYKAIVQEYYDGLFDKNTTPPTLILIRCVTFSDGNKLLDFRNMRKKKAENESNKLLATLREQSVYNEPIDPTAHLHSTGAMSPLSPLGSLSNSRQGSSPTSQISHRADESERQTVLARTINQATIPTDHVIQAITHDRLILKLSEPSTDHYTREVFWLTYRDFMTPQTLLVKLLSRYEVPELDEHDEGQTIRFGSFPTDGLSKNRSPTEGLLYKHVKYYIRTTVMELLDHWIKNFPFDWDSSLVDMFQRWVYAYRSNAIEASKQGKSGQDFHTFQIASTLLISLKKADRRPLHEKRPPRLLNGKGNLLSSDFSGVTLPFAVLRMHTSTDIAEQLTLLDQELIDQIHPLELFGRKFETPNLQYLCPNLLRYHNWTQRTRTAFEFMLHTSSSSEKPSCVTLVLQILGHLKYLHSWNMVVCVWMALTNAIPSDELLPLVSRIPSELQRWFSDCENLCDRSGGYARLRQVIHTDRDTDKRFLVPVTHLVISSMTLAELEGTPIDSASGKINFSRACAIYAALQPLLESQNKKWANIGPNVNLQAVFLPNPAPVILPGGGPPDITNRSVGDSESLASSALRPPQPPPEIPPPPGSQQGSRSPSSSIVSAQPPQPGGGEGNEFTPPPELSAPVSAGLSAPLTAAIPSTHSEGSSSSSSASSH